MMKDFWSKEIISALDMGKRVYLEYGALNDEITGYEVDRSGHISGTEDTVVFKTTACVFPKEFWVENDTNLHLNYLNDCLFVELLNN